MTAQKTYRAIAHTLAAIENCKDRGNDEWLEKHRLRLERIMDWAPSGGGIDSGTKLDMELSTPNKIVFHTSFHHMDENGGYDGWTEHTVTVRPSLLWNFDISISGRNRNDIKEHLHDTFQWFLERPEMVDSGYTEKQWADARLIAAAPELLDWAMDAAEIIKEYQVYAEEMRSVGRGFSPVGKYGHASEDILAALQSSIDKATGEESQ
jgi:hypothetical protein